MKSMALFNNRFSTWEHFCTSGSGDGDVICLRGPSWGVGSVGVGWGLAAWGIEVNKETVKAIKNMFVFHSFPGTHWRPPDTKP